jgi:hypothetical protein
VSGWLAFLALLLVCWSYPAWPDRYRRGAAAMLLHGPGEAYRTWRANRGR